MKKKTLFIALPVLLLGLLLALYPTISNLWNSRRQSKVVSGYKNAVSSLSEENVEKAIADANSYNKKLLTKNDRYELGAREKTEYESILNIDNKGVMGYVEIPKISVMLPILHYTDSDVLQFAAGHIPGTSVPVGGESTHCAISGHRGLPSAKLFSDLDELQQGDVFRVYILNMCLVYEVDRITIVDPEDMSPLEIEEGKDYFTLVTCTPYGVNTHRLLVRGHRTEEENIGKRDYLASEAVKIGPETVALFVFAVLILFMLLIKAIIRVTRSVRGGKSPDVPKGKMS